MFDITSLSVHDDALAQTRFEPAQPRFEPAQPRSRAQKEIDSQALMEGEREILIRHGNECYRLRHTRNDKLILTK